jgi:hypothetical protein
MAPAPDPALIGTKGTAVKMTDAAAKVAGWTKPAVTRTKAAGPMAATKVAVKKMKVPEKAAVEKTRAAGRTTTAVWTRVKNTVLPTVLVRVTGFEEVIAAAYSGYMVVE